MRLFWQYLQVYWRPPDRHICATAGRSERPRPASDGIGYAVLMEVKEVNGLGVNGYQNDTTSLYFKKTPTQKGGKPFIKNSFDK